MTAGRKKRWLRLLAGGCLTVVLVLLLLPVWFPWVLRPVLAHFGVRFGSYERVGYTGFALTDIRVGWPGARFSAGRAQGLLPPLWLWRRYAGEPGEAPFLAISKWS